MNEKTKLSIRNYLATICKNHNVNLQDLQVNFEFEDETFMFLVVNKYKNGSNSCSNEIELLEKIHIGNGSI